MSLLELIKSWFTKSDHIVENNPKVSGFKFSKRSLKNLKGVNPDLVKVAKRALELSRVDFAITEGVRSEKRQTELLVAGKTTTMNSRHLTGHAVDVMAYVDGKGTWENKYYKDIAKAFKKAAKELGVKITWGGDFKSFKDDVHFQIAWK